MKRLDAIKSLVAEDLDWPLCHEDCAWLLARIKELESTVLSARGLLDTKWAEMRDSTIAKLDEEV